MTDRRAIAPDIPGLLPPRAPDPAPLMVLPPQSARAPGVLLDLPDLDMLRLCAALQNVSFGMNYGAKRIVAGVAAVTDAEALSAKQRNALIRIGHRYRRQIAPAVRRLVEYAAR